MASRRAERRKACTGKQRFGTEQDARRAIWSLRSRKPDSGWLTAYKCRFCGGFHFGHPPRRVRQAISARGWS